MNRPHPISALCAVMFTAVTLSANASLIGVLPATSGGTDWQAVYDDDRNISWVANANLADTMDFGVTGINASGSMNWDKANEWVDAMNTASYLGFSDWRLPITPQPDASCSSQEDPGGGLPLIGFGTGCTGSEMGHLFNDEGVTSATPGLFSNVQSSDYWSGTEADFVLPGIFAWRFGFDTGVLGGSQGISDKSFPEFAWAVRSGNVSAVPVPAAVWLFGSGLIGLLGLARRQS